MSDEIFRSRWIVCEDCGCSTTVENDMGVPDEEDWNRTECLVCGSFQSLWNGDERTQIDARDDQWRARIAANQVQS